MPMDGGGVVVGDKITIEIDAEFTLAGLTLLDRLPSACCRWGRRCTGGPAFIPHTKGRRVCHPRSPRRVAAVTQHMNDDHRRHPAHRPRFRRLSGGDCGAMTGLDGTAESTRHRRRPRGRRAHPGPSRSPNVPDPHRSGAAVPGGLRAARCRPAREAQEDGALELPGAVLRPATHLRRAHCVSSMTGKRAWAAPGHLP